MSAHKLGPLIVSFLLLTGCGGEWIDDKGNFKRVFGFDKPAEVRVIRSYYWKSSHWSVEYKYYIELETPSSFFDHLTDPKLMDSSTAEIAARADCTANSSKPSWFLSKPLNEYQAWIPKGKSDYRLFREKPDGKLFICAMRL